MEAKGGERTSAPCGWGPVSQSRQGGSEGGGPLRGDAVWAGGGGGRSQCSWNAGFVRKRAMKTNRFVKDFFIFFVSVSFCLDVCLCTTRVPAALGGQKRASDLPGIARAVKKDPALIFF